MTTTRNAPVLLEQPGAMKGSTMNTNTMRVADAPIARTADPITSFEAGENREAREASERAVLVALSDSLTPLTSTGVFYLASGLWTEQRIRTAIKQLIRKGLVVEAGRREGASPTGRAAMTYTLAGVSS